jgi:hypothetical protein
MAEAFIFAPAFFVMAAAGLEDNWFIFIGLTI